MNQQNDESYHKNSPVDGLLERARKICAMQIKVNEGLASGEAKPFSINTFLRAMNATYR